MNAPTGQLTVCVEELKFVFDSIFGGGTVTVLKAKQNHFKRKVNIIIFEKGVNFNANSEVFKAIICQFKLNFYYKHSIFWALFYFEISCKKICRCGKS